MSAGTQLMRVVNFLTSERKRQGRNQADVAAAIGRTQSTLAKWECGRIVPNGEELFLWAAELSVCLTPERAFCALPCKGSASA